MCRDGLVNSLNLLLNSDFIKDYCPNGLQVSGKGSVQKIITGVTASQALIDAAVAKQADMIIVHHGYFWKNEDPRIIGMKHQRLKTLLANDISLVAYHLPLDVHPTLGNNAQLGTLMGMTNVESLHAEPQGVVQCGHYGQTLGELAARLESALARSVLVEGDLERVVKRAAWCTGGGQGYIDNAAAAGMDVFITGEVSEQTIHAAREQNIAFIAAGHHATERGGVAALAQHIQSEYAIDAEFIDIPNPA
jgi:dinuclear metal center YbgI/SA1388 family protein